MVVIGSAGVLAPGKLRWLKAVGWMVALCVAIIALFNAVARATLWLTTSGQAETAGDKLVAALAGSLAILLIYRVAVGFGERRTVPELSLRRAPLDLLLGLAIGFALVAAIVGLLWLFGWVSIDA